MRCFAVSSPRSFSFKTLSPPKTYFPTRPPIQQNTNLHNLFPTPARQRRTFPFQAFSFGRSLGEGNSQQPADGRRENPAAKEKDCHPAPSAASTAATSRSTSSLQTSKRVSASFAALSFLPILRTSQNFLFPVWSFLPILVFPNSEFPKGLDNHRLKKLPFPQRRAEAEVSLPAILFGTRSLRRQQEVHNHGFATCEMRCRDSLRVLALLTNFLSSFLSFRILRFDAERATDR